MTRGRISTAAYMTVAAFLALNATAGPGDSTTADHTTDVALAKIECDLRRLEMKLSALETEYKVISARRNQAKIDLAMMEIEVALVDTTRDQKAVRRRLAISQKTVSILDKLLVAKEREVDLCLKGISQLTVKKKAETSQPASPDKQPAFLITVDKSGTATLRGAKVRDDTVEDKLFTLGAKKSDTVTVKADPTASYEAIEAIIRALREAGFSFICL